MDKNEAAAFHAKCLAEADRAAREKIGALHETLWKFCKRLPTDFEPYGQRSRDDDWGPDCSCGCKHMLYLQGSGDWGVCCNAKSPRAGLLTWEHQGCKLFEDDAELAERTRRLIESQPGYREKTQQILERFEQLRKKKHGEHD